MGVAAYPSKLRARRRRERILRVSLLALGLAVVLGSLVALAYLPRVTITTIDLEGLSTIPQEEVRAAVERELSQRYFFLLPKRNIFLYPRAGIERALLAAYPKLRTATVSFTDFNRIRVTVEERSPFALWCEEDRCSFLDRDGFLYAKAPEFSGTVFIKYYGVADGGPVGGRYLTPHIFRSLSALVTELGGRLGEPVSVSVAGEDVEVRFLDGFSLFLSLADKPEDSLERLTLALSAEPLKGKELARLSYIDLRFGDRVVYKFK